MQSDNATEPYLGLAEDLEGHPVRDRQPGVVVARPDRAEQSDSSLVGCVEAVRWLLKTAPIITVVVPEHVVEQARPGGDDIQPRRDRQGARGVFHQHERLPRGVEGERAGEGGVEVLQPDLPVAHLGFGRVVVS